VQVAVGTFNLNNLFSRFDFRADVSTASASTVKVEERTSFSFDDPSGFKLRTYLGKLVRGKLATERALIAGRIKRMDLDASPCRRSRTSTRCASSPATTSAASTRTSS
jgi:hypothetical protein